MSTFLELPLSRGLVAKISPEDAHLFEHKWSAMRGWGDRFYACRTIRRDGGKSTILLHRVVLGASLGDLVDHLDGDGLNNTRENLRFADKGLNARNVSAARSDSASGYIGVGLHRRSGLWQARIWTGERHHSLGYFKTPEEAHVARLRGELERFGVQPRRREAMIAAGIITETGDTPACPT
jgi:hypothetical protein